MQTIRETLQSHPLPDSVINALSGSQPFSNHAASKICFFDIETTGLSADVSSLYLIGCAYMNEYGMQLIQWFANDYVSEKDMVHAFLTFLSDFELLVHYNGNTFDLPYIKSKCGYFGLDPSPLAMEQFDLYAYLRSHKSLLPLTSLRQTAVEDFLGVRREDAMDGGSLIHVYSDYMKHKYFRSPQMELDLRLLLLHNKEDVWGLLRILPLIGTLQGLKRAPTIRSIDLPGDAIQLKGEHPFPPSFPITMDSHTKMPGIALSIDSNGFTLAIPIFWGEMKYFYANYKDYYYLPLEDAVIHKSVASYVDPKYREKVSRQNCFTVKTGRFIPSHYNNGFMEFRKAYRDKAHYIELTDELLRDLDFWSDYALRILEIILR